MKKTSFFVRIIAITSVLIIIASLEIYTQSNYFNKIIDNGNRWGIITSVINQGNGFIICGNEGNENRKLFLRMITDEGEVFWVKKYGSENSLYYAGTYGSLSISNDSYLDLGATIDYYNGFDEAVGVLYKFNTLGDSLWTKKFLPEYSNFSIVDFSKQVSNGNYFLIGEEALGNFLSDILVINTDSSGNQIWRNYYGYNNATQRGFSFCETPDSHYLIGGYVYYPGNDYSMDAYVIKIDSLGSVKWQKRMGSTFWDNPAKVAIHSDGDYIIGFSEATYQGPPYPVPPSYRTIALYKLDTAGQIIWHKTYAGSWKNHGFNRLKIMNNGDIIAVGQVKSDTIDQRISAWMLKTNSFGDSLWYREYDYYDDELGYHSFTDITTTNDGGFLAVGQVLNLGTPGSIQKMWLVKLDSNGCDTPNCDPTVVIPIQTAEYQQPIVFPNPFTDKFTIELNNKITQEPCYCEIYDYMGRLQRRIKIAGNKSIVDMSGKPSGMYMLVFKDRIKYSKVKVFKM